MKNSQCPKCGNNSFEMVEESVKYSQFQLRFIRCEKCHTVVGVMDCFDSAKLIELLAEKNGITTKAFSQDKP